MVFYAEKYLITKIFLETYLIFEWKRQEIVFITSFNTVSFATPQNPLDQRWASTLTSQSNARHPSNTQPSIERSERSYFFEKSKSKLMPSTAIVVDCCRS